MFIKISTDSTADIPASLVKELDISVLPLRIESAEGEEWLDGTDMPREEFCEYLHKTDKLPSTAAVPPLTYVAFYEECLDAGYTDLIHVSLNGSGSSTYSTSVLAREMFYQDHPEAEDSFRIHLLDGNTYSMGYGLGVVQAARMAADLNRSASAASVLPDGSSVPQPVKEILDFLDDWIKHNVVLFVPTELSFVRKSGRISGAAALIGDALGLKPIITFEDGSARTLEKVRGEKAAMHGLVRLMKNTRKPGTPISIVGGADEALNASWNEFVRREITDTDDITDALLGCVIMINSGPRAFGIIYRI